MNLPLLYQPHSAHYISLDLPLVSYQRLLFLIVILYQIKNERLNIVPVNRFLFRNGNKILSIEDSRDSLNFEKSPCQWRYSVSILFRSNINGVLFAHDYLGGGHKFEEMRIGSFLSMNEQIASYFGYYVH